MHCIEIQEIEKKLSGWCTMAVPFLCTAKTAGQRLGAIDGDIGWSITLVQTEIPQQLLKWLINLKFCRNIYVAQTMNLTHFGEPLTLPLASPGG